MSDEYLNHPRSISSGRSEIGDQAIAESVPATEILSARMGEVIHNQQMIATIVNDTLMRLLGEVPDHCLQEGIPIPEEVKQPRLSLMKDQLTQLETITNRTYQLVEELNKI